MKKDLPDEFCQLIRQQLPPEEYQQFILALQEDPVCSVRLNKMKPADIFPQATPVPWCSQGRYLPVRPSFTLDPLLHAGCYYVQEASSMFISHLIKQYVSGCPPLTCLDLCAAPGGKSTLLLDYLPAGSLLIANEPISTRANILKENIIKWGSPHVILTSNYPSDFSPFHSCFDLILCDAPCSGEGMFRKDPDSIAQWSMKNVLHCQERQRQIVTDIWDTLRDGGLFIYSTCTYNHFEDEDNVQWICDTLGADTLPLCDQPEWGIRNGHFFPHRTRGEGFFVAIIRKRGDGRRKEIDTKKLHKHLTILLEGTEKTKITDKHRTPQPSISEALSYATDKSRWTQAQLSHHEAVRYLHGEAIQLPPHITERGYILLTYQGHPLGFCKNIGTRANNLYPSEWRIRKQV